MKIEDLKETAALAHLNLGESELSAAFPAFEQMLGYFAAMQNADEDRAAFPEGFDSALTGASNNSSAVSSNFFRTDSAISTMREASADRGASADCGTSEDNEKLIGSAEERDGRFLVIPNVL